MTSSHLADTDQKSGVPSTMRRSTTRSHCASTMFRFSRSPSTTQFARSKRRNWRYTTAFFRVGNLTTTSTHGTPVARRSTTFASRIRASDPTLSSRCSSRSSATDSPTLSERAHGERRKAFHIFRYKKLMSARQTRARGKPTCTGPILLVERGHDKSNARQSGRGNCTRLVVFNTTWIIEAPEATLVFLPLVFHKIGLVMLRSRSTSRTNSCSFQSRRVFAVELVISANSRRKIVVARMKIISMQLSMRIRFPRAALNRFQ
jgi:hypothetical protein